MKSIIFIILYYFFLGGIFPQSLESNFELFDLSGVWKFQGNDNLDHANPDIDDSKWNEIKIPGLWKSQNFGQLKTGWYRTNVYIPVTAENPNLSFLSASFTDAYEVYFNGIKIGGEGKISEEGKCISNNSRANVHFIPSSIIRPNTNNTIAIRVCNYAGFAGAFGEIAIGATEKVKEKFFRKMIWNVSIGFVFLFVAFYHLILFSGSRKDLSYLYFALACFFAFTLTLGYFRFTYWIVDSYTFHFYFFNSGFGLVTLFLILFAYSFFEYKTPRIIILINYLVIVFFLLFLIAPFHSIFLNFYIKIGQPALILVGIPYSLSLFDVIFRAIRDKKKGSSIIGLGLLFLLLSFIPTVFLYFNVLKVVNLLPESFLVYILCIAIALSAKFYSVNDQLLLMQKKHSEELEKRIHERTKDLEEAKKTAEIETGIAWIAQREAQEEKEKTEKLLREIQKDMLTAQKIQQNILPQNLDKIKKVKIGTIYKPISSVGGDFFDIEEIKPGLIRAFIADATGHGVQAALITMAIKSEYESVKDLLNSPARILKYLNENFANKYKSLHIYFTAFIIDIDTMYDKITFASAGHNPQFIITDNGIKTLSQRGHIIGMIPDADYEEIEKEFKSGRLVLLTDGIEEEFNPEQEQFGEERVLEVLKNTYSEPIQKSLDTLFYEMKSFIGSNRIRDDITLIGIDYKT